MDNQQWSKICQRIQATQRLNAGNLSAYLVGLIEGDGWFSISKNGKYLTYEMGIELNIRDIKLLYKIKSWLNVGIIIIRKDKQGKIRSRIFRVRNKKQIKDIIFPIFDLYPILSIKHHDYLFLKKNLLSGTVFSENLETYTRPTETISVDQVDFIRSLDYFAPWLIGFIEAEGCFSVYKAGNHPSNILSFDIAQKNANNLMRAIKKYLGAKQIIYLDKTNCSRLKVSSARSIENIIKFIQKAPCKLQGYKKIQYLLWLKEARKTPRYNTKFTIPEKY